MMTILVPNLLTHLICDSVLTFLSLSVVIQLISVIASLISLSWSLVSYLRILRVSLPSKVNMTWPVSLGVF